MPKGEGWDGHKTFSLPVEAQSTPRQLRKFLVQEKRAARPVLKEYNPAAS